MEPTLNEGVYAYATVRNRRESEGLSIIASVREPEGLSIVVPEEEALKANLPILFRCAWITLTVDSDLEAVGLTAAFSAALAKAGISCNVVAGACHDHIFVPIERADEAMRALRELQRKAL